MRSSSSTSPSSSSSSPSPAASSSTPGECPAAQARAPRPAPCSLPAPAPTLRIPRRVTDAAFNFLLVWYYCTLTIRESILINNGSRWARAGPNMLPGSGRLGRPLGRRGTRVLVSSRIGLAPRPRALVFGAGAGEGARVTVAF